MITAEELTKQRDGRAVVSDVTFRCEPGTITGFLGRPTGAGKTTTMRMLVGVSEPDRGAARILGGRYRDLPNPGRRVGTCSTRRRNTPAAAAARRSPCPPR